MLCPLIQSWKWSHCFDVPPCAYSRLNHNVFIKCCYKSASSVLQRQNHTRLEPRGPSSDRSSCVSQYETLSVWHQRQKQRSAHVTLCKEALVRDSQVKICLIGHHRLFMLSILSVQNHRAGLRLLLLPHRGWDERVFESELCVCLLFIWLWEVLLLIVQCLVKTGTPCA